MNNEEIIKTIQKRIQTTMIGALARFEDNFGFLWEKENSAESDRFWDLWEKTRNQILNNGNHQCRSIIDDINKFANLVDEKSKKYPYQYKFNLNNKGDKNED
jgi:hypothetical protein